jgi:hypothetical protein
MPYSSSKQELAKNGWDLRATNKKAKLEESDSGLQWRENSQSLDISRVHGLLDIKTCKCDHFGNFSKRRCSPATEMHAREAATAVAPPDALEGVKCQHSKTPKFRLHLFIQVPSRSR